MDEPQRRQVGRENRVLDVSSPLPARSDEEDGVSGHRKLLFTALLLISFMTATIIVLALSAPNDKNLIAGANDRAAATYLGSLTVLVVLFSMYAIQTHDRVAAANRLLIRALQIKSTDLEKANLDTIRALARALETKDVYTSSHGDRTEHYAQALACRLDLPPERCERVRYAAILHDIGKIGVVDPILNKKGWLTFDEQAEMRRHPEYGARILKHIEFLRPIAPIVDHHERFDGKGYPDGLIGNEIPMESRIISVLDTYDALTSNRPYRSAPGIEIAIRVLREGAGTQFDADVVKVFLTLLSEEEGARRGNA